MRDPDLQKFMDATHKAIRARQIDGAPVAVLAEKIFAAAQHAGDAPADHKPATLDVCHYLSPALVTAATQSNETAAVADAFSRLAPRLHWHTRPAGKLDEPGFQDNHANTQFVGVGGLEEHDEIRIGASLVAPDTNYPDHNHPPEELYLVLSPGEWRNTDNDWHAPGIGGLMHNPPGITHAMRAGSEPLLAIWCLWTAE